MWAERKRIVSKANLALVAGNRSPQMLKEGGGGGMGDIDNLSGVALHVSMAV